MSAAVSYKVTAPLVIIPNVDGKSGDWYGYSGALVPKELNDERCKQLVKEGMLEKVKADQVESEPEPKSDKVDDILADVGDDQAKAAEALEQEKAGKNRVTLVEKLEALANPAQS